MLANAGLEPGDTASIYALDSSSVHVAEAAKVHIVHDAKTKVGSDSFFQAYIKEALGMASRLGQIYASSFICAQRKRDTSPRANFWRSTSTDRSEG